MSAQANAEYRRRPKRDVWHWCLKCRFWPKDGTPFLVRGMKPQSGELCDSCLALDKHGRCFPAPGISGMSQVAVIWALLSGLLVAAWLPLVILVQESVSGSYAGIALILAALTPVMLAIIGVFAARFAKETKKGQEQIHALVNDQMTREKAITLVSLKAQMVALNHITDPSVEDGSAVTALAKQIASLEEEIAARDRMAAQLAAEKGA